VCISGTFSILLPVVPVIVERQGPHGAAGAATAAIFIGAVAGELSTPWLMRGRSSTRLLFTAQMITALPSLFYLLPHPAVWVMVAAAGVRGVGMGVAIVVSVSLLSEITPPHRRGASIGAYGVALSGPGIFIPSIGVFLLAQGRSDIDFIIAFAVAIAGALFAVRLPDRSIEVAQAATSLPGVFKRPGLLVIYAGFVLTSCSFGGVYTYAPVALPLSGLGSAAVFLLVAGAARALSRWLAGLLGDRRPARTVLIAGMSTSLAGLIALAAHGGPPLILLAAAAYGAGYGAVQTSAYLAMIERGTTSDSGAISALWNSGIDFGSSVGGTLIGLAAAHVGYAAAVWVLPVVVAMSLPLFLIPSQPLVARVEPAELMR
jgi:predicted MFS family arabinose efflux permease